MGTTDGSVFALNWRQQNISNSSTYTKEDDMTSGGGGGGGGISIPQFTPTQTPMFKTLVSGMPYPPHIDLMSDRMLDLRWSSDAPFTAFHYREFSPDQVSTAEWDWVPAVVEADEECIEFGCVSPTQSLSSSGTGSGGYDLQTLTGVQSALSLFFAATVDRFEAVPLLSISRPGKWRFNRPPNISEMFGTHAFGRARAVKYWASLNGISCSVQVIRDQISTVLKIDDSKFVVDTTNIKLFPYESEAAIPFRRQRSNTKVVTREPFIAFLCH